MTALMSAQQQREATTGKKGPSGQSLGGKGTGAKGGAKRPATSPGGKGTKPRQGKAGGRPARGTNPSGGGQRPPGKPAGRGKETPPGQRPKS
jgi:hypothetical protein